MRVLIVGSGGREHALAWKLASSPQVERIWCAPGNAGTQREAKVTNVAIAATDITALADFAARERVDLTVVGPEQPLVAGIVDHFQSKGLAIFGPSRAAAQLEGSKAFAKQTMERAGVPTAAFEVFEDVDAARAYLQQCDYPQVIKADGLAAGKGVVICHDRQTALTTIEQIMLEKVYGSGGARVVIEEFLPGEEVSVLALCSGEHCELFAPARDHKTLHEEGRGPNTGGMGAYTPVPGVDAAMLRRIESEVFKPVLRLMREQNTPFYGVLYAGLMLSKGKPYVLEFNVRFGDPETQPLLFHMRSELLPKLMAVAKGGWHPEPITWHPGSSLCVVLAAAGYPQQAQSGVILPGLDSTVATDFKVFHAGTRCREDGVCVSAGGRVLGLTARGSDMAAARRTVYEELPTYVFEGAQFRRDIGA